MKWAGEEEPLAGWEGPRGADTRPGQPSSQPPPPAPTRRDLRPPRSLRPSQPAAGGGPEADVVQSRERAAQGTAPGARRANRGERGGTRAGRLPSTLPAPPASRRAARGSASPAPPAERQGQRFPGFTQTGCHSPSPRAPHPRSSGTGRGRAAKGVPAL